ncbi:putative cytochrome c oxidase copper chaperone Cox17 [Thermoascus aurantiacus ATCC 26904]
MSWLFGSSSAPAQPAPAATTTTNTQSSEGANKPKPCCVCKDEKKARDDCMLYSKAENPAETDCRSVVEQYRSCMASYGFKV